MCCVVSVCAGGPCQGWRGIRRCGGGSLVRLMLRGQEVDEMRRKMSCYSPRYGVRKCHKDPMNRLCRGGIVPRAARIVSERMFHVKEKS